MTRLLHRLLFGHWPEAELENYPVPGEVASKYVCAVCGRALRGAAK